MPSMKSRLSWSILEKLPFKTTATEYRFNCILCPEPDTEFHLYVNRIKGVYHCFRCGAKGKLRDLADTLTLDSFAKVVKDRVKLVKKGDSGELVKTLPRSRRIANSNETNPLHRNKITKAGLYFKSRGFVAHEVRFNKLRVCIDGVGIYCNTVIFPIYNSRKELEYFVCRTMIEGKEPKYVNAPWNKEGTTFQPWTKHKESPYVVVCEGVFDALKIARVAPSIAILGKEANKQQIESIVSLNKPILVCLDQDAETYCLKLTANIASYYGTLVAPVFLKGKYKDPGEAPSKYLKKEFERAYLQLSRRSREGNRKRSPRDGTCSND